MGYQTVTSKSVFKSKTFWVNVISFAAYALAYPQINSVIPAQDASMALFAVNIILRFATSQPVSLTD